MPNASKLEMVANMTVFPEDGERFVLQYFVLCTAGPEGTNHYGLRVEKCRPCGSLIEREDAPVFTAGSLDQAVYLAERFAAGAVLPAFLQEMVDEWQHELAVSVEHAV